MRGITGCKEQKCAQLAEPKQDLLEGNSSKPVIHFKKLLLFIRLHPVLVVTEDLHGDEQTLAVASGVWNLSSPARDETCVPCIARQILNTRLTGKSLS